MCPTPVLPDYAAPFKPVPNVTPFTIRDGSTMLKKIDGMQKYIQRVLIPWINENFAELADAFETQVNYLLTQVNAALAEQTANNEAANAELEASVDAKLAELEAYINAAVESIISSSIEVSDPVVTALLANPASTSYAESYKIGAKAASDTIATYPVELFGTDFDVALNAAINYAHDNNGKVLLKPGKTYHSKGTTTIVNKNVYVDATDAIIVRDADSTNTPLIYVDNTTSAIVNVTAIEDVSVWAGYAIKRFALSSNATNGQTITIAGRTYTFVTALSAPNQIKIGATMAETINAIVSAINADSFVGTRYSTGTAIHNDVSSKYTSPYAAFIAKAILIPDSEFQMSTTASGTFSNVTNNTTVSRFVLATGGGATLSAQLGDYVKIFSDDLIPWDDPTYDERLADILKVSYVKDDYVYIFSTMRITLSTNIRVVKLNNAKVRLVGGTYNDVQNAPYDRNAALILLRNCVQPSVRNVSTKFGMGRFIQLTNCVKADTENVSAEMLRTSLESYYNSQGYGIMSVASVDGTHKNLRASNLRHAYTTGASSTVAGGTDVTRYGGVIGDKIIGGHAVNCEHASFDTHEESFMVSFENCTTVQHYRGHGATLYGFGLRGYRNRIIGGHVTGPGALNLTGLNNGGDHYVEIYHIRNTNPASGFPFIDASVNDVPATNPKCTIKYYGTADPYSGTIFRATSYDLLFLEATVKLPVNVAANTYLFSAEKSKITCLNLYADLSAATFNGSRIARLIGDLGNIVIEKAIVKSGLSIVPGDLGAGAGNITIKELHIDVATASAPTNGFVNVGTGTYAANIIVNDKKSASPGVIYTSAYSSGGNKDLTWSGRYDDHIIVSWISSVVAGIGLASLPAPAHDKQRLTIVAPTTNAGNVTVTAGATNVVINASYAIPPGGAKQLVAFNNTWVAL
jgi:hypothetical protein